MSEEKKAQATFLDVGYHMARRQGIELVGGVETFNTAIPVSNIVKHARRAFPMMRSNGTLWLHIADVSTDAQGCAGLPWAAAVALRADGWYVRSEIVVRQPDGLFTTMFLMAATERYFYIQQLEPAADGMRNQRNVWDNSNMWPNCITASTVAGDAIVMPVPNEKIGRAIISMDRTTL